MKYNRLEGEDMREIYLGTKSGILHPCGVEYLKHDAIGGKYYLYFFDRTLNDFCFAEVVKQKGKLFVKEIDYRSYEGLLHALGSLFMNKEDITKLPPVIPYYETKKNNKTNLFYGRSNGSAAPLIRKVEYLELESYCNALKDDPEYYYFIVQDMKPFLVPTDKNPYDGAFEYYLNFVCSSSVPLKKNIIARHKTDKSLYDLPHDENIFKVVFPYNDKLKIDLKEERRLVLKIMELEKNQRKDMDPVLLTKVVRMMIQKDDYVKAALEYQIYLEQYYDKWVNDEKYKHL
ncbi:MAG: hypothetical protein K2G03_07015 [Bacilli bacterium]|nr:hypothetical protein [Bacilli bacterium]MDE6142339.1 hypothetical protein [Bacilli bacterium]